MSGQSPITKSLIEKCITESGTAYELAQNLEAEFLKRGDAPELPLNSMPELNRKLWGLQTDLMVLGGRTSQGKTALALQIAWDIASQGKETMYLSLEMSTEALIERLFCRKMEVSNIDMLIGKYRHSEDYQNKWLKFREELKRIPLILSCSIGKTFEEINTLIALTTPKPRLVIIDYIQAISKSRNERQDLDKYIVQFRQLCIAHKIAGILVSQNSRKVMDTETKEPALENLKGTGGLEESARTVILIFWPHFYNKDIDINKYTIYVAKQSNGRTGRVDMKFTPDFYKFEDWVDKPEDWKG